MFYLKERSKTLCADNVLLSLCLMLFCFITFGCRAAETRENSEQGGSQMPLFSVKEAELVDVLQYLAYSAVPMGDNVYFDAKEKSGTVLYEIGESNQVNFVACPARTGQTISLVRTNISVRSAARLVADVCGMEYCFTNGTIQIQTKKISNVWNK